MTNLSELSYIIINKNVKNIISLIQPDPTKWSNAP